MVILETIEEPVKGEPGKVFSTRPEVAIGNDGKTYYIKGCNSATSFTEVAGCLLAEAAGMKVPRASLGVFNGDLYASTESVVAANRNIRPWLSKLDLVENGVALFEVIAVDTWLANDDRNMGNVIGSSLGNGRIDLFMIDFERSRSLAENPFMGCGSIDPRRFWPTEELGRILRPIKPPQCPEAIITRIRSLSKTRIRELVTSVAIHLSFVTWSESSIEVLINRAQNIDRLVEAVWETN